MDTQNSVVCQLRDFHDELQPWRPPEAKRNCESLGQLKNLNVSPGVYRLRVLVWHFRALTLFIIISSNIISSFSGLNMYDSSPDSPVCLSTDQPSTLWQPSITFIATASHVIGLEPKGCVGCGQGGAAASFRHCTMVFVCHCWSVFFFFFFNIWAAGHTSRRRVFQTSS